MFVYFEESGREALQGGHEPERLILHKALESAGVEFS